MTRYEMEEWLNEPQKPPPEPEPKTSWVKGVLWLLGIPAGWFALSFYNGESFSDSFVSAMIVLGILLLLAVCGIGRGGGERQ